MIKVSLVFVILHYMVERDTAACIDSIRQYLPDVPCALIVVDNASPDGSGDRLKAAYEADPDVTVLMTDANLGFARGNNVGIDYARAHYDFDFCIACNNDILLMEAGLYDQLKRTYDETHFAVLGPMIYTKAGTCNVNPGAVRPVDEDLVARLIARDEREMQELRHPLLKYMRRLGRKLGITRSYEVPVEVPGDYLAMHKNVELHGSFLVFSPLYFEKFDGFYSGTFMYNEERFLHYLTMREGLVTVYQPGIRVYHKEDASTDAVSGGARQKRLFYLENSIASLKILQKLLKEDASADAGD